MKCGNCRRSHATVDEVKRCYQNKTRTSWKRRVSPRELEQTREKSLRAHGLKKPRIDKAKRASEMRSQQTPAEIQMGYILRGTDKPDRRKSSVVTLGDWKSQFPLAGYTLDFFSLETMLCIEVDGSSHNGAKIIDVNRDENLAKLGIETLRFTNSQVLAQSNDVRAAVLKAVRRRCSPEVQQLREEFIAKWREKGRITFDEPPGDEEPPTPPAQEQERPQWFLWFCHECRKHFTSIHPRHAKCPAHRRHRVRKVCEACRTRESPDHRLCGICEDARDVARRSAGQGARAPSGDLPQARRGRKYKGGR